MSDLAPEDGGGSVDPSMPNLTIRSPDHTERDLLYGIYREVRWLRGFAIFLVVAYVLLTVIGFFVLNAALSEPQF